MATTELELNITHYASKFIQLPKNITVVECISCGKWLTSEEYRNTECRNF